jgi:hypothetical protein
VKRFVSGAAVLGLAASLLVFGTGASARGNGTDPIAKRAAEGTLTAPTLTTTTRSGATVERRLPFISDSTVEAAQEALGVGFGDERLEGADAQTDISDAGFSEIGQTQGTLGCARRDRGPGHGHNTGGGNVRVNQDCTFRRQAERRSPTTRPIRRPDRRPERQPRRRQPVRHRLVARQRAALGRPAPAVPAAAQRAGGDGAE